MRWRGEGVAEKARTSVTGWPAEGYMVSPDGSRWPKRSHVAVSGRRDQWLPHLLVAVGRQVMRALCLTGECQRPVLDARPVFWSQCSCRVPTAKEGTYQIVLA